MQVDMRNRGTAAGTAQGARAALIAAPMAATAQITKARAAGSMPRILAAAEQELAPTSILPGNGEEGGGGFPREPYGRAGPWS